MNASVLSYLVYSFLILTLFALPVKAQVESVSNPYLFDLTEESARIGWLPGEKYDIFTGQMHHSMVDLNFEGNGLPITLNRVVRQSGSAYATFSHPVISISPKAINGSPRVCNRPSAHSSVTFEFGDHIEKLYRSTKVDANNVIRQQSLGAVYISKNNWLVKCNGAKYEVYAPDGTIYKFDFKLLAIPRSAHNYGSNKNVELQHVKTIEDRFGNTLEYTYAGYRPPYARGNTDNDWNPGSIDGVETITAKDGRRVTFYYGTKKDPVRPHDEALDFKVITKVATNGSPKARVINYDHSRNYGYKVDYGQGVIYDYAISRFGNLQAITYPEGGKISYGYVKTDRGDYSIVAGGNYAEYQRLKTRTVTNRSGSNAKWDFEWKAISGKAGAFARLIHTPSHTSEYRYTKHYHRYLEAGYPYEIKYFNEVKRNWSEYSTPLLSTNISYIDIFNECDDMFPGSTVTFNVRKSEEKTKLYSGSSSIEFRKTYEYSLGGSCDPYYQLRRTREYAADNQNRRKDFSYKHPSGSERWVVGNISNVSTDTGDKVQNYYDSKGSLTNSVENGITTDYTYHGNGKLHTTKVDGDTYTLRNYYRGIPREERDELDRVKRRSINSDGTIKWESTWGDGGRYTHEYDSLHRLTKTDYPGYARTSTHYAYPSPNKIESNSGNYQYRTVSEVDDFGYPTYVAELSTKNGAAWRTTRYKYDFEGRMTQESFPSAYNPAHIGTDSKFPGKVYNYDGIGRMVSEYSILAKRGDGTTSASRTRTWSYPNISNREAVVYTDGKSKSITTTFVSYGSPSNQHIRTIKDQNNVTTNYNRDKGGRITSIVRAGKTRSYAYNWRKQVKSITSPEEGVTTFAYYADGNLNYKMNNGRKTKYWYNDDSQVRIEQATDSSGTVTKRFYYNDSQGMGLLSNTQKVSDDSSLNVNTSYDYDSLGNMVYERTSVSGVPTMELNYEYDDLANLQSIRYPSWNRYDLAPNAFGEPTEISSQGGKQIVSNIKYRPTGQYQEFKSGKTKVRSRFDASYRVLNRYAYNDANKIVKQYNFAYDQESNMTWLKDQTSGAAQSMGYDSAGRLISVRHGRIGSWNMTYDSHDNLKYMSGNGHAQTYNYNGNNRLTKLTSNEDPRSYDYNIHGDVKGMHVYKYDTPDQLNYLNIERNAAGEIKKTSNDSNVTKYAYDVRGLRAFKEKSGRIYTVYDQAGKLRYRYDPSTDVKTEYFYITNELVAKREIANSNDSGSTDNNDPNVAPSKPTNVKAEDNGGTVTITWNAVAGAEKYNVYFNDSYLTTKTGITSHQHVGVSAGTHSYYVIAKDDQKKAGKQFSGKSAAASVTVGSGGGSTGTGDPNVAPSKPTNVKAQDNGGTVTITWNAVAGAEKYNVYFNDNYLTTKTGITSHQHVGVSAGTHSYYVTAKDDQKNAGKQFSGKSAPASVTVGSSSGGSSSAKQPTGFRGTVYSKTAMQLDWIKPNDAAHGGNATQFQIYKNGSSLITTNNGNSFWLSNLSAGQTNTFQIVAIYPDGARSSKTAPISITMND